MQACTRSPAHLIWSPSPSLTRWSGRRTRPTLFNSFKLSKQKIRMYRPSKHPPRSKKKRNLRKKLRKQVNAQMRSSRIETTHKRRQPPWFRLSKRPLRKKKKPRRNKRLSKKERLSQATISVTIGACLRKPGSRPWKRRNSKRQTKPQVLLNNLAPLPSSPKLPQHSLPSSRTRKLWLGRGPGSLR